MRRTLVFALVTVLTVVMAATAWGETREHGSKKVSIDGSYHKPTAGVNIDQMRVEWCNEGLKFIRYHMAAWKGTYTLEDIYVVEDGKVVYKRSSERKLGHSISYTDLTDGKYFFDRIYLTKPVAPFTREKGEIWFVISYEKEGQPKDAVVIWKMSDNSIDWKPLEK